MPARAPSRLSPAPLPDASPRLGNPDLAPVATSGRNWGAYHYAALWVALSFNIPAYLLAGGMMAAGMSAGQAIFTVFLGSVIVLGPLLLNAHAGARYGVPFPVFARGSFGVLGAHLPAILRAVVACGWLAIETWIGGEAANALLGALAPGWNHPWLCFFGFWTLNLAVMSCGIDALRRLTAISAPLLAALAVIMLFGAWSRAGSFGPLLSAPSKFHTDSAFFGVFAPSLTAVVAFWAAVALNIPDFTRYARSQKQQMLGQGIALPAAMTFWAFVGVAVASATAVIFGRAIWDPVGALARLGRPWEVVVGLAGLLLAALNVNVAANLVAPANVLSNFWPRRVGFRLGGAITCLIALLIEPWKLRAGYAHSPIAWLVGTSTFLAPIAGILIADYYLLRKKIFLPEDLYQRGGFYEFSRGVNWRAVAALAAGVVVSLAGLAARPLAGSDHAWWLRVTAEVLVRSYDYSWFAGFAVSFIVYLVLMRGTVCRSPGAGH